jgi:hypothetical protein
VHGIIGFINSLLMIILVIIEDNEDKDQEHES